MSEALEEQIGGSHYKDMAIQPVEYIHANNLSFLEGNIVKYVSRWRSKNGIEDLHKARHYIDLLIQLEERRQKKELKKEKKRERDHQRASGVLARPRGRPPAAGKKAPAADKRRRGRPRTLGG